MFKIKGIGFSSTRRDKVDHDQTATHQNLGSKLKKTTTKLIAFGFGNPSVSVSVPCNGEQTHTGSLAQMIHDLSFW